MAGFPGEQRRVCWVGGRGRGGFDVGRLWHCSALAHQLLERVFFPRKLQNPDHPGLMIDANSCL